MLVREGVEEHGENFRTFCLWCSDTPILLNFEGAAILFWILQTTSFAAKLPYSWVNENWDFLAENYVFLEYFLTRNM